MASVDETPTSPIRERGLSLLHQLEHRPDVKELKERGIIMDPAVSPDLAARQKELDRQLKADALKKHLTHRPEKDDLVQRNILPPTTAAPQILQGQKELEKRMLEDKLAKELQHRPPVEEVIKKGILNPDEDPTKPTEAAEAQA
ncbi:hypothetical protein BJ508DRAFT_417267 [Ascobolus immersus RN42]|uniref:RPEL repeat protein n=1 Tax=Ascobolus immersus RN42 TaxID=1160509 RepID=A0A3N4HTM7_ASCIM|nr:hypothetical protein BJ508DRAFT_417267 [Ascobolus immersus RN42]